VTEQGYHLKHALLEANFFDVWFEGVHISYGSYTIYQDTEFRGGFDTPLLEMVFNLQGDGNMATHDKGKVQFLSREHNILYVPPLEYLARVAGQQP
jgi:uncharacterized protein YcgL (UPF0745 family)